MSSPDRSRRPNGTTQTFRRPSNQAPTTSMNSQNRESSNTAQNRTSVEGAGVYIPPHRNGATSEGSRYSKDQLLDLYRAEHTAGDLRNGIGNLFMSGWEPKTTNGASSASWGRRDDQRDAAVGADACWVPEGNALPISLTEMTAEEREVKSSLVLYSSKLTFYSFSVQLIRRLNHRPRLPPRMGHHETLPIAKRLFQEFRTAPGRLEWRRRLLVQVHVDEILMRRILFPLRSPPVEACQDILETNLHRIFRPLL